MESEWEKLRLGDITEWSSGGTPSKSKPEYWDGDFPWISARSMGGSRYEDSQLKITELGLNNGSKLALEGSILILVRGSILHQKIQVGIASKDVAFNQDVKSLYVKKEVIEPWYLLFWFMSKKPELLGLVENTGIGAGKLDTAILKNLIVDIPPEKERKKILSFLKALDDKIDLNRQMNETLEAMAQALFKSWFVDFDPVIDNALAAGNDIPEALASRAAARQALGDARKPLPEDIRQLFPSRFEFTEEMEWVPEGWGVTSVDEALTINPRITLKKGEFAPFVEMKALPTTGYGIAHVGEKDFKGGAKFNNGDVLFARITPCLQNGKTGIVDFLGDDDVGFGSTEFIVMRGNENLTTPFVACLARDINFRNHCMKSMVGSSGRQRVQNACFSNYFLALPNSKEILRNFHNQLSTAFKKITIHKDETNVLSKLRDTLLPKLLSGELRIPDAEKLVQEAL